MAAAWYYEDLGTERGPFTAQDFRRLVRDGEIQPGTLVRKEADGRWILANKVRGLFDEAPIEPTGGAVQPQTADVETGDFFGIQKGSIPVGYAQAQVDYATRQNLRYRARDQPDLQAQ